MAAWWRTSRSTARTGWAEGPVTNPASIKEGTVVHLARVILLSLCAVTLSLPAAAAAPEMARVEVYSAKDAQMATQALIASHKGYFKAEGLDVDLKYYQ